MAIYAEFYRQAADGSLIAACGDRSIIKLDGRSRQATLETIAETECRKRGYIGWQLIAGHALRSATPITRIVSLYY